MEEDFKSLYDVLEDALRGKRVRLRAYPVPGQRQDEEKCVYGKDDPQKGIYSKAVGWKDDVLYEEWTGTVESIGGGDNSHVDIHFRKDLPHTKPDPKYYDDCFNWHMMCHIAIEKEGD